MKKDILLHPYLNLFKIWLNQTMIKITPRIKNLSASVRQKNVLHIVIPASADMGKSVGSCTKTRKRGGRVKKKNRTNKAKGRKSQFATISETRGNASLGKTAGSVTEKHPHPR